MAVDLVRRDDDRAVAQLVEPVLRPDAHGESLVEQLAHERHDDHLMLEHLEQSRRALRRRERLLLCREVADSAHVQGLGGALGRECEQRLGALRATVVDLAIAGRPELRKPAPRMTAQLALERGTDRGKTGVIDVGVDLQHLLLDDAVRQDGNEEEHAGLETDELHREHLRGIGLRAGDHGGVAAHAREQAARLVQQIFERLVRRREEVGHGALLPDRQAARRREVVDEEAISAVGGHAAGRRVGLAQIAVALEHRHLVADGGARHAEAAFPCDGLRANGLGRLDVLLDDRLEDRGLALVELLVGHGAPGLVLGEVRAEERVWVCRP